MHMDTGTDRAAARARAAGRPAAAVLALAALTLLPPLASSTRLGGGRASAPAAGRPVSGGPALHPDWRVHGYGGSRDGASPARPTAPHVPSNGARRLALGDAVQGCTQTFNSLPSLASVTAAVGWELSRCGSWFAAPDAQRYQACYLSCASGTYADASTDYSNSSFWCARAEMDKAILCTEPSVSGGEWTCPGCAAPGASQALGCSGANRTCTPTNDLCSGNTVQGVVAFPRLAPDAAAPATNWAHLRCHSCAVPTPRPGLHVNPVAYSYMTNNYKPYSATFGCEVGYWGAPVTKVCAPLCVTNNASLSGGTGGACAPDGGGEWDGGWPNCAPCTIPTLPPGVDAIVTSGAPGAPYAVTFVCGALTANATCSPDTGQWSVPPPTCESPSPEVTTTSSTTATPSGTPLPSVSASPSATSNKLVSASDTPSHSATPSSEAEPSATSSASGTRSETASVSATRTPPGTVSATPSNSASTSLTATQTASHTPASTPSFTGTAASTPSGTGSAGPTPPVSRTVTASPTHSASPSVTASRTATRTGTRSGTGTPSGTPSNSPTPSFSRAPTPTQTPSPTASITGSPSVTPPSTRSATATLSAGAVPSSTPLPPGELRLALMVRAIARDSSTLFLLLRRDPRYAAALRESVAAIVWSPLAYVAVRGLLDESTGLQARVNASVDGNAGSALGALENAGLLRPWDDTWLPAVAAQRAAAADMGGGPARFRRRALAGLHLPLLPALSTGDDSAGVVAAAAGLLAGAARTFASVVGAGGGRRLAPQVGVPSVVYVGVSVLLPPRNVSDPGRGGGPVLDDQARYGGDVYRRLNATLVTAARYRNVSTPMGGGGVAPPSVGAPPHPFVAGVLLMVETHPDVSGYAGAGTATLLVAGAPLPLTGPPRYPGGNPGDAEAQRRGIIAAAVIGSLVAAALLLAAIPMLGRRRRLAAARSGKGSSGRYPGTPQYSGSGAQRRSKRGWRAWLWPGRGGANTYYDGGPPGGKRSSRSVDGSGRRASSVSGSARRAGGGSASSPGAGAFASSPPGSNSGSRGRAQSAGSFRDVSGRGGAPGGAGNPHGVRRGPSGRQLAPPTPPPPAQVEGGWGLGALLRLGRSGDSGARPSGRAGSVRRAGSVAEAAAMGSIRLQQQQQQYPQQQGAVTGFTGPTGTTGRRTVPMHQLLPQAGAAVLQTGGAGGGAYYPRVLTSHPSAVGYPVVVGGSMPASAPLNGGNYLGGGGGGGGGGRGDLGGARMHHLMSSFGPQRGVLPGGGAGGYDGVAGSYYCDGGLVGAGGGLAGLPANGMTPAEAAYQAQLMATLHGNARARTHSRSGGVVERPVGQSNTAGTVRRGQSAAQQQQQQQQQQQAAAAYYYAAGQQQQQQQQAHHGSFQHPASLLQEAGIGRDRSFAQGGAGGYGTTYVPRTGAMLATVSREPSAADYMLAGGGGDGGHGHHLASSHGGGGGSYGAGGSDERYGHVLGGVSGDGSVPGSYVDQQQLQHVHGGLARQGSGGAVRGGGNTFDPVHSRGGSRQPVVRSPSQSRNVASERGSRSAADDGGTPAATPSLSGRPTRFGSATGQQLRRTPSAASAAVFSLGPAASPGYYPDDADDVDILGDRPRARSSSSTAGRTSPSLEGSAPRGLTHGYSDALGTVVVGRTRGGSAVGRSGSTRAASGAAAGASGRNKSQAPQATSAATAAVLTGAPGSGGRLAVTRTPSGNVLLTPLATAPAPAAATAGSSAPQQHQRARAGAGRDSPAPDTPNSDGFDAGGGGEHTPTVLIGVPAGPQHRRTPSYTAQQQQQQAAGSSVTRLRAASQTASPALGAMTPTVAAAGVSGSARDRHDSAHSGGSRERNNSTVSGGSGGRDRRGGSVVSASGTPVLGARARHDSASAEGGGRPAGVSSSAKATAAAAAALTREQGRDAQSSRGGGGSSGRDRERSRESGAGKQSPSLAAAPALASGKRWEQQQQQQQAAATQQQAPDFTGGAVDPAYYSVSSASSTSAERDSARGKGGGGSSSGGSTGDSGESEGALPSARGKLAGAVVGYEHTYVGNLPLWAGGGSEGTAGVRAAAAPAPGDADDLLDALANEAQAVLGRKDGGGGGALGRAPRRISVPVLAPESGGMAVPPHQRNRGTPVVAQPRRPSSVRSTGSAGGFEAGSRRASSTGAYTRYVADEAPDDGYLHSSTGDGSSGNSGGGSGWGARLRGALGVW